MANTRRYKYDVCRFVIYSLDLISRYGLNRLKLSSIRPCDKTKFLNIVRPMHVVVTRYLVETVDYELTRFYE